MAWNLVSKTARDEEFCDYCQARKLKMILKHICRKETRHKQRNAQLLIQQRVGGCWGCGWPMGNGNSRKWIDKCLDMRQANRKGGGGWGGGPLLWTLVLNGYQEVSRSGGSNKLFANIYGQFHCFTFRCRTSNRLLLNHWQTNGQQDRGRASSGLDIILRSRVVDLQTSRYEHAKIFLFEFHFPQESSFHCKRTSEFPNRSRSQYQRWSQRNKTFILNTNSCVVSQTILVECGGGSLRRRESSNQNWHAYLPLSILILAWHCNPTRTMWIITLSTTRAEVNMDSVAETGGCLLGMCYCKLWWQEQDLVRYKGRRMRRRRRIYLYGTTVFWAF